MVLIVLSHAFNCINTALLQECLILVEEPNFDKLFVRVFPLRIKLSVCSRARVCVRGGGERGDVQGFRDHPAHCWGRVDSFVRGSRRLWRGI